MEYAQTLFLLVIVLAIWSGTSQSLLQDLFTACVNRIQNDPSDKQSSYFSHLAKFVARFLNEKSDIYRSNLDVIRRAQKNREQEKELENEEE